MRTTTKKSNDRKIDGSAYGIAVKLIRILSENGFQRAITKNRYFWSEGFYVSLAKNLIRIDYHVLDERAARRQTTHVHRWSKVAQMREVLSELGYLSSQPRSILFECTRQ